jgi:hypothetical protein
MSGVSPIRPPDQPPADGAFGLHWRAATDPVTGRSCLEGVHPGGWVNVRLPVITAPAALDVDALLLVLTVALNDLGGGAAELMAGTHTRPDAT